MKEGSGKSTFMDFLKDNWLIVVVLLYVFIPIDFIPDRLPLIGNLDDTSLILVEAVRRYADYKKTKKK